jgi:hypothetical protein
MLPIALVLVEPDETSAGNLQGKYLPLNDGEKLSLNGVTVVLFIREP